MRPYISKHVTYEEVIASSTAKKNNISNEPTPEHLENIKRLASDLIEPLRLLVSVQRGVDTPLFFSSFYRSAELNKFLPGASPTSKHKVGLAVDIDLDGMYPGFGNTELFKLLAKHRNLLAFDQLIWEYGDKSKPNWVHVGLTEIGTPFRNDVFAVFKGSSNSVKIDWI